MARKGPVPGTPQARAGGEATRAKYGGSDHFVEIGKRGGSKVLQKHGREYFAEIGKRGGVSTKRLHGQAFYAEIGRVGGSRPKPKKG
jgi:general stress protein YciG